VPQRRFRQWRRIGYVPQRIGAGSGVPATVREVVASGRLAKRGFLRPAGKDDRQAITDAIALVGLAERAGEPVSTLSGGQQQRTLIARALAGEPDLLVLDEPTAGVDAASQEAFAGALVRFVAGGGTVILVAHELGPLQPVITRAVVVHEGVIAHDGPVPKPAGHHAHPEHGHVHPHAPDENPGLWGTR
jgi:zinc transport system ATP-binding protein